MFGVCDDEKNALAVDEPSLQPLSFCSGNPAKCRGGARSDREPGGGARGGGGVTALLPGPPFLHREKRQD